MTSSLTAVAPWLWVPVVLFAALAQTVRNSAQRSLTQELGTFSATLVRFLYGLPFAAVWLWLLYVLPSQTPSIPHMSGAYFGWIALGARGTMIGRAMVYGLGAFGEAGVTKALQILHKELDVTMAFCGHTNIQNVDRSILVPGTYPTAPQS